MRKLLHLLAKPTVQDLGCLLYVIPYMLSMHAGLPVESDPLHAIHV